MFGSSEVVFVILAMAAALVAAAANAAPATAPANEAKIFQLQEIAGHSAR